MCGVIGIVAKQLVNQDLYNGLTVMQHRGQDAAGIATCDGSRFYMRKSNGLVHDVFHTRHMLYLKGNMGIGHIRYPTAGSVSPAEAQPFYVSAPYGITMSHNGNLINSEYIRRQLVEDELRHINTNSDSEVLLNVFAYELSRANKRRDDLTPEDIFTAVRCVHERCSGGYATVAMIAGVGIVGFRDIYGIRPLVFGQRETDLGMEYMIASESVAMSTLNYKLVSDVKPGAAVFIDIHGKVHTDICSDHCGYSPCIFEHVYLARPDSIIDGISVYQARLRMGEALAKTILAKYPDHDIDVVIPVPDSSRTAALALAHKISVEYREGFVKNRYIPRTFIMPGQNEREESVKQKLNIIDLEFKNKNVLIVDDSIVRGTTSQQIVSIAREAGAKKVYFASAAPPVRYPNVYGIDMPSPEELIAHQRSTEEVAKQINADWLVYQDIDDLIDAVRYDNPNIKKFDSSCFTGEYVTGDVNTEYLHALNELRNDCAKQQDDHNNNMLLDLFDSSPQ